jgi:response regulator NasT
MVGNDIFIAFANKKTAMTIAKIILSESFDVSSVVLTANDLKKKISYYDGGIIVCGCRFTDDNINNMIEEIPESFKIILLGTPEQLQYCYDSRLFKLAVPLNKADLVSYLGMLVNKQPRRKGAEQRTQEERMLINKAKRFLISRYQMTEPQAHRYLEKKSMDTGRPLVEIAKSIVS